jgi:hypothetical protein
MEPTTLQRIFLMACAAALAACGSTSKNDADTHGSGGGAGSAGEGPGDAGPSDASAGQANAGGAPFGYTDSGYGFAGYGGDQGFAGAVNVAGFPGYDAGTASSCDDFTPPAVTSTPRLSTCDEVAALEVSPRTAIVQRCYAGGSYGSTCSIQTSAIEEGWCGNDSALVLGTAGTQARGASFIMAQSAWDLGGYEGIGFWAKAAPGTTVRIRFALWDAQVFPQTPVSERSCYYFGDDWDGDGRVNLALPPLELLCDAWTLRVSIDDQWRYVMLPWGSWKNRNAKAQAAGIVPAKIREFQIYTDPCADIELWITGFGGYRTPN